MASEEKSQDNAGVPAPIDRLIHEPARLTLMAQLYVVAEADFLFLERQTGLTRGNLSSHLSKLEQAGYVEITKEFIDKISHTVIRLTERGRTAFDEYRKNISQVIGDQGSG